MGDALQTLSVTRVDRPALRDGVLADLRDLDPEAEAIVRDIIARAGSVDAAGKAQLISELCAVLPAAESVVNVLSKHALAGALPAASAQKQQQSGVQ